MNAVILTQIIFLLKISKLAKCLSAEEFLPENYDKSDPPSQNVTVNAWFDLMAVNEVGIKELVSELA